MFFGRNRSAPVGLGQSPQYLPGEAPARKFPGADNNAPAWDGYNLAPVRIPETVTSGFDEHEPVDFQLHYTRKPQPDRGGALNYSYDLYGLPLGDVCGPWMVANAPYQPIGSRPLAYYQTAPLTSIGGLIPGQLISQPLLDPNGVESGYDIYS